MFSESQKSSQGDAVTSWVTCKGKMEEDRTRKDPLAGWDCSRSLVTAVPGPWRGHKPGCSGFRGE